MDARGRRQATQEHLAPLRERAAQEAPVGYEPAEQMNDSLFGLLCLDCGASVSRRMAERHDAWHRRLWERLGGY